jgi:heat shock protein HslJ
MRTFLAVLALALAACASAPDTMHLSGTSWRRVDDENANPHGATLEFAEARASGYTGCNRWFASVEQDGDALRFGEVGMTRMACAAEPAAATERSFLAVLPNVRYARIEGDALVLLDANQTQVARFQRDG